MKRVALSSVVLLLGLAACQHPAPRLNAPPHGTTHQPSDLQGSFVYMTDNALLADMTVSEVHFLPHRAQLTTLGQERLARLAALMDAYGGEIRFNTDSTDTDLNQARVAAVVAFLSEAGVKASPESIKQDMPGGRGMNAREAILIRTSANVYKPPKDSGGGLGAASGGQAQNDKPAGGSQK
jgi:hypothetical protein